MKNYTLRFSVILPTYDRCYILWRAIKSVLSQTYPFFELIIVDDGSSDETEKLINIFKDPRIKYFKLKKNRGASGARNFGMEKAIGEFIAYIDSDNLWYDDFLQVMNDSIEKCPDKVLFFSKKNYRLTIVDENGDEQRLRDETTGNKKYFDIKRLWHRRIIIDTNTMCHRKEEVIELGGWDEEIKFWEDWELTLRISKKYPDGFMYLNRALVDYEQKIEIADADKTFAFWESEERKIFEKHEGHPLLTGQTWFPPRVGNRSTLGVIDYLRNKYKSVHRIKNKE